MKQFLLIALALLMVLVPVHAFAQFGPIVPEVCRSCPCGFGGVLAIIQNMINFVIALSIIIATIIIAWAGGLYMISATNPESRSQANKMMINAVVGILIVLSAWLIVDFVMSTLYGKQFGPWNTILMSEAGNNCVVAKPIKPLFSGNIFAIPGQGTGGAGTGDGGGFTGDVTSEPVEGNDGQFDYDPGIRAQTGHASTKLAIFLSCVSQRVPANVGRIASISDSDIVGGKTFDQCSAGGCNHSARSCHYGGAGSCNGSSYAVDFGDGGNDSASARANNAHLESASRACGADYLLNEGDHLHVSVGRACGCN
ncbi:MAG: pilin [Patescibacteria group bacterium]